ncbi:CRISPR-associated endonuclease Cas1 [Halomonas sp.]|uniref:CRISPR-associated endonuclease Cas1 n=1 Tax=Halomonas sp. TaxID=1486246 RepID=UPI0038504985
MGRVILDRRELALEYITDCLLIRSPDQPPRTLPLARIQQLICLHSVQVTTQLIGQLLKRGIDFIVVNQRHVEHGFSLFADHQRDATRRALQYRWQEQDALRLAWSRRLVIHKLKVASHTLQTTDEVGSRALRESLARGCLRVVQAETEDALRGMEGAAQKAVFAWWRKRLPESLGFNGRKRRPPPDPVNAVLSLSYVLAHDEAARQLKIAGLDPCLGMYHRLVSGRLALACDLMEPLRPVIEAWVMSLFLERRLDSRHFGSPSRQGCLLGKQGRLQFYEYLEVPQRQWRKRLAGYARVLANAVDARAEAEPSPVQEFGNE